MLTSIRRLCRQEDGQALVLAALLLFAVALGVLGTANLGRAIHSRIELQNAADTAAYGLASHQARAFNFYAYTNRAQISQYVTIMQLLSVDSMLLGVLNSLGSIAAVMKNLEAICDGAKKELCLAVPVLGELLVAVSEIAGVVEATVRKAGALFLAFDRFVGEVAVPLLVGANLFLFANQASFHAQVVSKLADQEALRIARVTAPDAELWGGEVLQAAGNIARFVRAHFPEAARLGGTQGTPHLGLADGADGRKNWARRGMSELIHATRYDPFVYDRAFPRTLAEAVGKVIGVDQLGPLSEWIPGFGHRGHTRLHSEPNPRPSEASMKSYYRQMEESGTYTARYPTGSSIGANFYPHSSIGGDLLDGLGFGEKHLGSVTSTGVESGGGWACAWDLSNPYKTTSIFGLSIYVPRYSCTVNQGSHRWWGITPYMAFNAAAEGCDRAEQEHCQPDVWVALHRPSVQDRSGGIDLDVAVPGGIARARNVAAEGSNTRAIARALAYYHRPGNWQEQPNFFNPYWRAKLAPVAPGLDRLAGDIGLLDLGLAPGELADQVLTH